MQSRVQRPASLNGKWSWCIEGRGKWLWGDDDPFDTDVDAQRHAFTELQRIYTERAALMGRMLEALRNATPEGPPRYGAS